MITPTTIIPYMLSDADVRDRVVADIVEERVFGQAELCAEFEQFCRRTRRHS
jgi:hypothetical protein